MFFLPKGQKKPPAEGQSPPLELEVGPAEQAVSSSAPVKGETNRRGREACLAETDQGKSRERFPVLLGLIEQDQELALALQRQSRAGAERYSWSFFGTDSWSCVEKDLNKYIFYTCGGIFF